MMSERVMEKWEALDENAKLDVIKEALIRQDEREVLIKEILHCVEDDDWLSGSGLYRDKLEKSRIEQLYFELIEKRTRKLKKFAGHDEKILAMTEASIPTEVLMEKWEALDENAKLKLIDEVFDIHERRQSMVDEALSQIEKGTYFMAPRREVEQMPIEKLYWNYINMVNYLSDHPDATL